MLIFVLLLLVSKNVLMSKNHIAVNSEDKMNCKRQDILINMEISDPNDCGNQIVENDYDRRQTSERSEDMLTYRKTVDTKYKNLNSVKKEFKRKPDVNDNRASHKNERHYRNTDLSTYSKIVNGSKRRNRALYREKVKTHLMANYKTSARLEEINLDINKYIKKKFPTTYYMLNKSNGTSSSMTIYLDIAEKAINRAAQTRNLVVIDKALSFYEVLLIVSSPPSRLLLQKADISE